MMMPRMAMTAEQRRRLAVDMAAGGDTPEEVADVLRISERSVWRWLGLVRRQGLAALTTRSGQGRPPKLTDKEAGQVLGWLARSPCDFGFATERWTSPRVTALIERFFGVRMNHRYVSDWLRRRGITPQVPERIPRERDERVIRHWIAHQWPMIKKK
jgi:transposase